MENELISRAQAAALLGISTWTLKRYERNGRLHPVRLSAQAVRIRRSELQALIDEGSSTPAVVPEGFRK